MFGIIMLLLVAFTTQLKAIKINASVVMIANALLFFIALITLLLHVQSIQSTNARQFVNSVMLSMLVKFVVIGIAVLIYAYKGGNAKSVYAIYTSMILYIFYTLLEVKIALQLNKKPNANN
ncbi:MAG: hypothetical protein H7101_05145 [Deinococcales bacterium]|nr:hypothetical protein [Chitinophagaceae bacterium]